MDDENVNNEENVVESTPIVEPNPITTVENTTREEVKSNYVEQNTVNNSNEQNGMALASFILGILSVFAWIIPIFGYVIGIPGLILGIVSRKKSKTTFSIVGIVLCSLGLVASLINSILGVMLFLNTL